MASVVSIKLDATDQASAKINRVGRELENLGNQSSLGGGLGGIVPTLDVGNIATSLADIGVQAVQATWDLGVMGAQVQRTEGAFNTMAESAGISGRTMLRAMQEASRGTVAESDLMAAANRAMVLEVADSADEMGALVEAAIIRGRQVGVGATQAVNDLVTGIGRMSPEILDNLGIANASSAFDKYAATLGTTADKLTDVQKKQALVNATLASVEGVDLVDDAAASFERMDASIQNAKEARG